MTNVVVPCAFVPYAKFQYKLNTAICLSCKWTFSICFVYFNWGILKDNVMKQTSPWQNQAQITPDDQSAMTIPWCRLNFKYIKCIEEIMITHHHCILEYRNAQTCLQLNQILSYMPIFVFVYNNHWKKENVLSLVQEKNKSEHRRCMHVHAAQYKVHTWIFTEKNSGYCETVPGIKKKHLP